MAKLRILSSPFQATACLMFIMLTIALTTTSAARILVDEQPVDPTADSSSSQTTASASPVTATGTTTTSGGGGGGGGSVDPAHTLTFFMHDILGGSNPTTRAVTGVVNNPAISGQVPFAKPNGAVLPVNNGVSSQNNNNNNGANNNNNLPFLTGLGGATSANLINNNNNNNGNNNLNSFPIGNGGQLPTGSALAQLMFGTINVIDDELTEGHELGSQLLGKAQGYYVASALDGTSQAMAFTAMFQSGHYEDSLNFFGVHRSGVSESQLAVMGGTGKYVNAKGYAVVKTITGLQHVTDGAETLLEFAVYVSY